MLLSFYPKLHCIYQQKKDFKLYSFTICLQYRDYTHVSLFQVLGTGGQYEYRYFLAFICTGRQIDIIPCKKV